MLKDMLRQGPARVRISYQGCGEQRFADERRFEAQYGLGIAEVRDAGFDANRIVVLEDVETDERATVNGWSPDFALIIYPQQQP